jgi:uncharacterized protein with HEPN domain
VRDDAGRLRDILNAIDKIRSYADKGRDEFEQNELVQVWILYQIQVIGEAARVLSQEIRAVNDIPPLRARITTILKRAEDSAG